MKSEPKDCLFQPEWLRSRGFNRQRGSLPIGREEGGNAGGTTEKGLEGMKWRGLSKRLFETVF